MARYRQIEQALERTARELRIRGRTDKTVSTYLGVIRRFLHFHRRIPPNQVAIEHFEAYLAHLTENRRLATGTRNQAAAALSFYYRRVLGLDIGERVQRATARPSVPVVFSHGEVGRVLAQLHGKYRLIGALLYGTGMRLGECLGIRVKDLDFDLRQITVRKGKGGKDRFALLPGKLVRPLRDQIRHVLERHRRDRAGGAGWARLPFALDRKIPRAGYEPEWQFLFPASRVSLDPSTGRRGRHHLHPTAVQRKIKRAIRAAGISKAASTHTLRHTFATQLLRDGYDPRTVQQLLGHKDIRVTMQYLHAVQHTGLNVRSPLDRPDSEG